MLTFQVKVFWIVMESYSGQSSMLILLQKQNGKHSGIIIWSYHYVSYGVAESGIGIKNVVEQVK